MSYYRNLEVCLVIDRKQYTKIKQLMYMQTDCKTLSIMYGKRGNIRNYTIEEAKNLTSQTIFNIYIQRIS